ncbi:MAG: sigma-70 family RNA polymerase sigma factor [Planctomycetota bacterium]
MVRAGDPSDGELVAQVLAGDRSALAALTVRYDRAAFHLAYDLLGHREEALDVVQSSIVKMLESLATLREPERFGSWFLRLVRNKALDAVSSRSRRRTAGLEQERESHDPGPMESLLAAENVLRLRQAMRGLNDDQRAVIAMRYSQSLDYATIAERLGIPASTVRSRLYEARLILRARLAGKHRPGMEAT